MTKRQLITRIQRLNPHAQPQFLAQFDDAALRQYLDHLKVAGKLAHRHPRHLPREPKLRMVV